MAGESKKAFFITSAAILAILLTLAWGSLRAVRFLKKNAAILATARQELASSGERREALRRERSRRAVLERTREELKTFFVNQEDPLPFIEAVEALARRSGVGIELALVTQGAERESAMTYSITASGSYQPLMRFLNAFEQLPYAARIAELRFVGEAPARELRLELSAKTIGIK